MAKTAFIDGDKSQGILGTQILAAFMNKIFSHVHDGVNDDGHCSKIALAHLDVDVQPSLVPPGTVIYYAKNTAPSGYLKANGAAVSRTTYASLFAEIGTTFGVGNGSTTFNLPDLRGEFARGWDDGRGIDTGRVFGSSQGGEIQGHSHLNGVADNDGGFYIYGSTTTGVPGAAIAGIQNTGAATYQGNTSSTGGSETRPRNVSLLACIKY